MQAKIIVSANSLPPEFSSILPVVGKDTPTVHREPSTHHQGSLLTLTATSTSPTRETIASVRSLRRASSRPLPAAASPDTPTVQQPQLSLMAQLASRSMRITTSTLLTLTTIVFARSVRVGR